MKPIKLVIEGINSFTDAQTLDFEAAGRNNLFCISGRTGAGKSTVFDSLMLALYGKCGKGNLADVVNLSRMKARVILDFSSGADIYTVDRTITCKLEKDEKGKLTDRRKAVTDCMLYKNGAPAAKGSDETNAVITDIVGLDASEFKNVYLLEQGEYAAFLKKPPAEQTKAVGKIFSLMRFDEVYKLAAAKRDVEETEILALERSIGALGDVSSEKLKAEKTALASLKSKTAAQKKTEETKRAELAELDKVRDKYKDACAKQQNVRNLMLQSDAEKIKLHNAVKELEAFEATADKTLESRITELRKKLNELAALHTRDEECKKAEKEAAIKREAADSAKTALVSAKEKLAALSEKRAAEQKAFADGIAAFKAETLGVKTVSKSLERVALGLGENSDVADIASFCRDLEDELDKYKALCASAAEKRAKLEAAKTDCAKKLAVIEAYAKELEATGKKKLEAEKAQGEAQKQLERVKLECSSAAIAAELAAGDVCPVCGGRFDGEKHCEGGDVSEYKKKYDAAVQELKAATERETECAKHLDRAKNDFSHAEEQKSTVEKELGDIESQKTAAGVDEAVYDRLIRAIGEVKSARVRLSEADAEVKKHEPELSALEAKTEAATSAAEECETRAATYKKELGDNYGKTQAAMDAANGEIAELDAKYKKIESTRKTLTAVADGAKAAVDTVEKSLERARADCPTDIPEFDEEIYAAKKEEFERLRIACVESEKDIAVKETEIKTLAEKCDSLAKINAERNAHVKEHALYKEIADVTRAKAMLNYVAAEYIDDFTAIASEVLGELSHGKYSMSYDKTSGFVVSDFLNDGKCRKTDTLSGGELFLASLSVAIAIARTQSRGNNAFFFLDEGFGTLDNELIDIVYGALESLSRDCLVGVITHSDSLIEKMPSCVEIIEASDIKGSIIKY